MLNLSQTGTDIGELVGIKCALAFIQFFPHLFNATLCEDQLSVLILSSRTIRFINSTVNYIEEISKNCRVYCMISR